MKSRFVAAAVALPALLVALTVTATAAHAADSPPVTGYVGITFDDGPSGANTQQILDTLKETHSVATFFLVGNRIDADPVLALAEHDAGFDVGNHSYDHPDLTGLTDDQIKDQLQRTNDALEKAGVPKPLLWRPPFGATDDRVRALASGFGMSQVNFDNVPGDYEGGAKAEPAYICDFVVSHAQDQSIVLLHDFVAGSVTALPCIIAGLRAKGLEPGRLVPSADRSSLSDSYVTVVPPAGAPPPAPADPRISTDPTDDRDTTSAPGNATTLQVSDRRLAYLRFDLSGLPPIDKAILRVRREEALAGEVILHAQEVRDDLWSDRTAANRLPHPGAPAGSSMAGSEAGWMEIDVTPSVRRQKVTDDVVSFALSSNRAAPTTLTSSDAGADWPQLVLTPSGDAIPAQPPVRAGTPLLRAAEATAGIVVDGRLTDKAWQSVPISLAKAVVGGSDNTATAALSWDADNLYVAAKVLDTSLCNDSPDTYQDDALEVYLDGNGDGRGAYDRRYDRQFFLGYGDAAITEQAGLTTGVKAAQATVPGGWTAEFAIPWSTIGQNPRHGLRIGVDVGNDDDDAAGAAACGDRDGQLVGFGTASNYANLSGLARASLATHTATTRQPVIPVARCLTTAADGTRTATFGYLNTNDGRVPAAVGAHRNAVVPAPADRAQPRVFVRGAHDDAFTVPLPAGKAARVVWVLRGPDGVPRWAAAGASLPPCPPKPAGA